MIAIAVSGDSDVGTDISVFLCTKGVDQPRVLKTRSGATVDALIPWPDFVDAATFGPTVQRLRYVELMAFARELHDFMRDHAKLTERSVQIWIVRSWCFSF